MLCTAAFDLVRLFSIFKDEKSENDSILGTLLFYKNKQKINNLINAVEFYWKVARAEPSHI